MPRLVLFAACEKAILESDGLSLSVIGVFTGLTVELPESGIDHVPNNAVAVRNWSIATAWVQTPDDGDKTFEQKIAIVAPDGSQVAGGQIAFRMTHRNHNNVVRNQGFPVGQTGEYQIELSLREAGEANEWQVVTRFPIQLARHRRQPEEEGKEQLATE